MKDWRVFLISGAALVAVFLTGVGITGWATDEPVQASVVNGKVLARGDRGTSADQRQASESIDLIAHSCQTVYINTRAQVPYRQRLRWARSIPEVTLTEQQGSGARLRPEQAVIRRGAEIPTSSITATVRFKAPSVSADTRYTLFVTGGTALGDGDEVPLPDATVEMLVRATPSSLSLERLRYPCD